VEGRYAVESTGAIRQWLSFRAFSNGVLSPWNLQKGTQIIETPFYNGTRIAYGKIMATLISYRGYDYTDREEHLLKTLKWLESRTNPCPVCIRRVNELRDELALIRSRRSLLECPALAMGSSLVR
jgi:hypothetical protein